jgi:hypothetical protein
MKKNSNIIKELDYVISKLREQFSSLAEGEGVENIFNELKNDLKNISMLPNNLIDTRRYQEHEVVDVLRNVGYDYKKIMGNKLHFFNKKTSVSIYYNKSNKTISLQP